MALEDVVKQVTDALTQEGNARAVFGDPLKLETKTIIPVACVQLGGGGGGVRPPVARNVKNARAAKALIGGGGGLGFAIFPVGYLHEEHGEVVFTPISIEVKHRPLLEEASQGLGKAIDTVTHAFSAYAKKSLATGARPRARA